MPKFGALNQSIVGNHSDVEWSALIRQWKWRCFYCARPICKNSIDPDAEVTKDHMLPISRGGSDFIWNIVPACFRCNTMKGTMTVDEFKVARPGLCGKEFHVGTGEDTAGTRTIFHNTENSQTVQTILPPEMPTTSCDMNVLMEQWKAYCLKLKDLNDGYPATHDSNWYQDRRAVLRAQAASMKRRQVENAGQLTLPIFGDGTARKLAQSEASSMPFKGMDLEREA